MMLSPSDVSSYHLKGRLKRGGNSWEGAGAGFKDDAAKVQKAIVMRHLPQVSSLLPASPGDSGSLIFQSVTPPVRGNRPALQEVL